jgi:hypothetical protein
MKALWLIALLPALVVAAPLNLTIEAKDAAGVVTHRGNVVVPEVPVVPPEPTCPPDCPPPVCPGDPSCPVVPPVSNRVVIVESAAAPQDVPTYDYANMRLMLPWSRGKKGANWRDAADAPEGLAHWATLPMLTAPPANSYVHFNVPAALIEKLRTDNTGFLFTGSGSAEPKFATMQWSGNKPPLLEVVTTNGTFQAPVVLDTWTTVTSNSSQHTVHYFSPQYGILRFDLSGVTGTVASARLSLYPLGWYGPYTMQLDFLDLPELMTAAAQQYPELVEPGLTQAVGEAALATHPDVLVYCDLSSVAVVEGCTQQGWVQGNGRTNRFEQLPNGLWAMYCQNGPDGSTCTNSRNLTLDNPQQRNPKPWQTVRGSAPEDLYLSYMIKIHDGHCSWQGTKIPGMEGYLGNGQGGYAYTGWTNPPAFNNDLGWGFSLEHNLASPANGNAQGFGMYMYDQDTPFSSPNRGRYTPTNFAFLPGRWYHVEVRSKVNTLGQADGISTAWIDGVRVFHNTAWKARGHAHAQVLSLVFLDMHGGNGLPTCMQETGFARWVVSKSRVGVP